MRAIRSHQYVRRIKKKLCGESRDPEPNAVHGINFKLNGPGRNKQTVGMIILASQGKAVHIDRARA